jgi:hypothetical protein
MEGMVGGGWGGWGAQIIQQLGRITQEECIFLAKALHSASAFAGFM